MQTQNNTNKNYPEQERRKFPRGPRWWHCASCARVRARLWSLIAYSDTTPTRFILLLVGLGWSVMLAWPGDTFSRPAYQYMAEVGGEFSEWEWAVAWGLYTCGMAWLIFSSKRHAMCALIVNSWGVMLTSGAVIAILMALTPPLPAAIAPDIVVMIAAAWVLVRTHINSEEGWRDG